MIIVLSFACTVYLIRRCWLDYVRFLHLFFVDMVNHGHYFISGGKVMDRVKALKAACIDRRSIKKGIMEGKVRVISWMHIFGKFSTRVL